MGIETKLTTIYY